MLYPIYDEELIHIQCIEENIITIGVNDMVNALKNINTYTDIHKEEILLQLNGHTNTCRGLTFRLCNAPGYEISQNKIGKMTLVDLVEMICDWKASTLRHKDGNIYKSIADNQKRFGYSDEIKQILINTVKLIENIERDN